MPEQITLGSIARCRGGRLAVVTKIYARNGVFDHCVGIDFEGKSWYSSMPTFVSPNIGSYLEGLGVRSA